MRGKKLHDEMIKEGIAGVKSSKKGRNKGLMQARNKLLIYRYFYYSKILKLRFDLVLFELQKEFFLSIDTIPRIIEEDLTVLKGLSPKGLTVKGLKELYPHLEWNRKIQDVKPLERDCYVLP